MQQSGEYRVAAGAEAIWRALNDPDVLCRCIEGCQSVTRTADDAFEAVVNARIGPLSATFTADIQLADLDQPRSCTLKANVKGGAAGFGKGDARVTLSEDGGATLLRYEAQGNVGGKLAQIGQRLIDGVVRKMADDFFTRFGEIVAGGPQATPALAASQPAARIVWIGLAVAAVLAILAGVKFLG